MAEKTNGCPGSEPVGEDPSKKEEDSENGAGAEEGSEDGRDTLDDLTRGRPHLIGLLSRTDVVEKQPGDYLWQEGDEIHRCGYIVLGQVEVTLAGVTVAEVGKKELLGVDEFLLRKEEPTYKTAARAVAPTHIFWLDEDGLCEAMGRGSLKRFLRMQAGIAKQTQEALRRIEGDKSKLEVRVAQLGVALGKTQDDLATKAQQGPSFPPRPSQSGRPAVPPPSPPQAKPSPPTDLLQKLQSARQTSKTLVHLFETRGRNLAALLGQLRQIAAQHPDWQKEKDFVAFLKSTEELVTRDSRIDIVVPP